MAQGFLGAAVHFDVIEFGLGLHHPAGGWLDEALFSGGGQAGGELVFHWNHVEAIALPFLLLPAGPTDAQFFQQARAQLLELLLGTFVHNDSIGATAHHLLYSQFPGAEHPFAEQGHAQGAEHQGGEIAGFDVKAEAQDPAQHFARFGDHLAIDHLAVALRIETFGEGIGRIHQNHIAHLADALQGHPAGQPRQEAGQGVIAQAQGHHLAPVNIHHHFADDAEAPAGVAGDHLGPHQFRPQPEPVAGGWGAGGRARGRCCHQAIVAQSSWPAALAAPGQASAGEPP